VLQRHGAALCIHDMFDNHPEKVTASWVYLRFHGVPYQGNYPEEALKAWAQKIHKWRGGGLDVFAFFNNDQGGHAVHNSAELKQYVSA
jgi:uncharacterized protein YecE (DUF72 family)